MKFVALVVIAFVACALAKPTVDLAGHGQAAVGFASGVAAVPAFGLGSMCKINVFLMPYYFSTNYTILLPQ